MMWPFRHRAAPVYRIEPQAPLPASPAPMRITPDVVAQFRAKKSVLQVDTFRPPQPPPGVLPANASGMAQDDALSSVYGFASGGLYGEGIGFVGYPYLAELTQRPEYRKMSETIAEEMTRKWIRLEVSGNEDKSDRLAELEDALDKHKLRDVFRRAAELDGFYGMAHIYVDTGYSDDPVELRTELATTDVKIGRGGLKAFRVIDPTWTYPTRYNSTQPLLPDYYKPQAWFVMGKEVHASRLLTIVSRPMPDLLKPAYNFGGLSLSHMSKPYVDNWIRTRQSVSDLLHSFTVFLLKTNLGALTQGYSGGEQAAMRLQLFNEMRDNAGLMAVDRDTEDFANVSAPLGGLDRLQAQAQEQMASVSGIPLVKLLGITPSGLNACLTGDTPIETDVGQIAIRDVTVKHKVMTREGWAPLAWSGKTGYSTELIEIKTAGCLIRCTPNHPIYLPTINEFVHAENVCLGDLLLCRPTSHHQSLTADTVNQSYGEEYTGGRGKTAITPPINQTAGKICSTARFGACIRDLCHKGITSTISTAIEGTINSAISGCSRLLSMPSIMGWRTGSSFINILNMRGVAVTAASLSPFPNHRGSSSATTGVASLIDGQTVSRRLGHILSSIALFAAYLLRRSAVTPSIARESAQLQAKTARATCKTITNKIQNDGLITPKPAMQSVVSIVRLPAKEPIYDLQVAENHLPEFFANGICVHNSSDGEVRVFYDHIEALQEKVFREPLTKALKVLQLSLWGEIDPGIGFRFEPLWSLDETAKAAIRKTNADTAAEYIAAGVLMPEEERTRIAAEDASPYAGLDLSVIPEPPAPENDPEMLPDPAQSAEPSGEERDGE